MKKCRIPILLNRRGKGKQELNNEFIFRNIIQKKNTSKTKSNAFLTPTCTSSRMPSTKSLS